MQLLESLIGNLPVQKSLKKMAQKGAIPSTLLFEGPEGTGKKTFATAFAKELLLAPNRKHHPDLFHFHPENKTHTIASIKQLIQEAVTPPFEAKRKILIVYEAHQMLPATANALLKTLEEPLATTHIFLLSSKPELLLHTILSRCIRLTFFPVTKQDLLTFLKDTPNASHIATLAQGSFTKASKLQQNPDTTLHTILTELLKYALQQAYPHLLHQLDTLESHLEKEKDPTLTGEILSRILFWYRDLTLLSHKGDPKYLFYNHDELKPYLALPLPPLDRVVHHIDRARDGLDRHIRLKHLLEELFLSIH